MGNYLDEPVIDRKRNFFSKTVENMQVVGCKVQGWRRNMEDQLI